MSVDASAAMDETKRGDVNAGITDDAVIEHAQPPRARYALSCVNEMPTRMRPQRTATHPTVTDARRCSHSDERDETWVREGNAREPTIRYDGTWLQSAAQGTAAAAARGHST